ncbi:hypothetical protein HNR39_000358 [Glaciimonas immobilis]|uniref:Uncharacterized protein n=1 Tax=Glaciimonas immobilis TaxID=728004 RepID=A0A840RNN5_9BURK|nr:hypothetical protein [Glaciimonas immobilis]
MNNAAFFDLRATSISHRAPTPEPAEEPPIPGPGPTPDEDPVPDHNPSCR